MGEGKRKSKEAKPSFSTQSFMFNPVRLRPSIPRRQEEGHGAGIGGDGRD